MPENDIINLEPKAGEDFSPENDATVNETKTCYDDQAESEDELALNAEQLSTDLPDSQNVEFADREASALSDNASKCSPEKPRRVDAVFDFVELLLLTLAMVFVLTTFFFRHSIVDGDSMLNTLHNGDVLIISDVFYTPKQYDIVVIEDHTTGLTHPLVKRVIAVGGDEVKVTNDTIYVNGEPVRDDFVYTGDYVGKYTYEPKVFTVEEGHIYVLGDHRNDSLDSRKLGTITEDAILGKVLFRIYPFTDFGTVYTEEN